MIKGYVKPNTFYQLLFLIILKVLSLVSRNLGFRPRETRGREKVTRHRTGGYSGRDLSSVSRLRFQFIQLYECAVPDDGLSES